MYIKCVRTTHANTPHEFFFWWLKQFKGFVRNSWNPEFRMVFILDYELPAHSLINSITKKFNNHQIKYSAVFWLIWNVIMCFDKSLFEIAFALHAWVICHMFIIYSNRFVSNARIIWYFRLKRSIWALVFFFSSLSTSLFKIVTKNLVNFFFIFP